MIVPGPRTVRRAAGTVLLALAVAAAVNSAVCRLGISWPGSVYLWVVIALLAWNVLENDGNRPGGLPLWMTSAAIWAACCTACWVRWPA